MKSSLGDKTRLLHISECITEIQHAIRGYDEKSFIDNHVTRIAVVKWLEIIGEASNHITDETKNKYPDTDWNRIIALRNFVVHEYFGINFNIIWEIGTCFIPELKNIVTQLLKDFE